MRSFLAGVVLLGSATANAAVITIDFEQFAGVVSTFEVVAPVVALNDGFVLSPDPVGNALWVTEVAGPNPRSIDIVFQGAGGSIDLSRTDGAVFDFLSVDLAFFSAGTFPVEFSATKAGGAEVSLVVNHLAIDVNYATYAASPIFSDIVSLTIQTGDGNPSMALDNIVVSAVPVPAAVWLFGSALAGLGWMRRKQTV